ncbi:MAG: acyl-CoA dehydrogenase family protein [Burkholderiaceae bacterium]
MIAMTTDATLQALTDRFARHAAEFDRDGRFPEPNFADLHEQGLIGAVVPRRFGGGQASLTEARRIVAAVAAGDAATALVLTMTYLQHQAIARPDSRWPESWREVVLRSAVERGALINALRVEPELGSPARGGLPGTIARRAADGGWRLSGRKTYSTGMPALSWLVVWARTDDESPRVGAFLVPRDARGIRVIETWDHLGLRASGSHDAVFDDVALPGDHAVDVRLPGEWAPAEGSPAAREQAAQNAWMVVLLGSLYDAVARSAAAWLRSFLNERVPANLGKPLASLPRMQEAVGGIEALLWTNRMLLDQAAARVDAGQETSPVDSGLLKHQVTGNAIAAVEQALQLTGNHGLSRRNPLERHYRDVLCSRIHTPQNDVILATAGRAALGFA